MNATRTIRALLAAAITTVTVLGANAASAYERWVNVGNDSDWAIAGVQISNIDSPVWGPNLLFGDVIYSGEMIEVEPVRHDGNCRFDVLLTFEDGYEMVLPSVNLCEATDIVTDGFDYDVYYI